MNKVFVSAVVVAVVVGALLIFQATRIGTSLVLLPSQLLADEGSKQLTRIRVAGRVTSEAIEYQVEPAAQLKFRISDPGKIDGPQTIPVVYNGIKPDMFTSGRDVIIDGEFSSGVLHASNLLTQCPSKYEPPSPEKKYGVK